MNVVQLSCATVLTVQLNLILYSCLSGYGYIDFTDSNNLLAAAQLLDGGDGFSIATVTVDEGNE